MTRPPIVHHHFGCTCNAASCVRARRNQEGFDRFLLTVFAGLYLAGLYWIFKSGLFSWVRF